VDEGKSSGRLELGRGGNGGSREVTRSVWRSGHKQAVVKTERKKAREMTIKILKPLRAVF